MKATLVKHWDAVRASYWFVPSIMTLVAALLSYVLTTIDESVATAVLGRIEWLHANQPEGARSLLATIAGSMITVAGVTFSITIAAVAYASSQYGPRLLTNFMHDRGNQVTLGTFVATFLYCILVLRTIRSAAEATPRVAAIDAFVPHLAVLGGLLLGVTSVAVLIYFIHHVAESIHVSHVVARIGRAVIKDIERPFPALIGKSPEGRIDFPLPDGFDLEAVPIRAPEDGYVHNFDTEGLYDLAVRHDLTVRIVSSPGYFLVRGQTVLLAWPPDHIDDDVAEDLEDTLAQGTRRTPVQDILFLIDELVEIAARALSPGVNDPFTAMTCMDWLSAALCAFARREPPEACRFDDEGTLRVGAHAVTFEELSSAAYDQLRPYVSKDRNATIHMLTTMKAVAVLLSVPAHRRTLVAKATALYEACLEAQKTPEDRRLIERHYRAVARLGGLDYQAAVRRGTPE